MNDLIDTSTISDGVLSLLPLIYVGWSDSVLSPSEIKLIRGQINALPYLTNEDKSYLNAHLDPSSPPTDEVFKLWLDTIKARSMHLPHDQKNNIVELGIRMAASGIDTHYSDYWKKMETRNALESLLTNLAIDNPFSEHMLLERLSDSTDIQNDPKWKINDMTIFLDGPYHETKQRMRQLLRDPIFKLEHIANKEVYRERILEQVKMLAKQGVSAFSFPEKYGGGARDSDHIAVFEQLAYGDLSLTIKFGVQFGLFGGAIFLLGTEEHHRLYLEAMHKAELLGCFAMTETGHGSNVKGLETTATYNLETDEIIIHSPTYQSGKEYIGNAIHSTMAAVFAQLIVSGENHGVHAILVPIRNAENQTLPGVKIEDCGYKLGLNGVDNGRLWFDQVHVPRANLLNKYGSISSDGQYESPIENPSKRFFTMLGALVVGRMCVGLASNSASKKALSIATKYALTRRQFGEDKEPEQLIMDYPTHMARIIPAIAKTYAYHFALQSLANEYAQNKEGSIRKIETLAAGLKSKATWHATSTIQMCREACGGKGYLAENQFAALKADSDIFTTFEGDNTVLMQLVAKGVLTDFKQSFHDDGNFAIIKFLLKKMGHSMSELNPIHKRNSDFKHLISSEHIQSTIKYRYEKNMIKVSERMRKYLKRRIKPYQAFLKTQVHMIELADAYIDYITIKDFRKSLEKVEDKELSKVLWRLYQLYGLTTIYDNRGWYLENEYMQGSQSKAIRKIRTKLIQDLRPDVGALVSSFGIPNELIAAPIAMV